MIRCSPPGGALPYRASLISRSVASTPTWSTFTSTARPSGILQTCGWGWSVSLGTGMSRRWTLFGLPGRTATAFIEDSPDHGDARSIARDSRAGMPTAPDSIPSGAIVPQVVRQAYVRGWRHVRAWRRPGGRAARRAGGADRLGRSFALPANAGSRRGELVDRRLGVRRPRSE